jgi:hypothetical protein
VLTVDTPVPAVQSFYPYIDRRQHTLYKFQGHPSGVYITYKGYSYIYPGDTGIAYQTMPIDRDKAIALAMLIIERRAHKPFESWTDFNRFIDELAVSSNVFNDDRNFYLNPPSKSSFWGRLSPSDSTVLYNAIAGQAMADVVKANANPDLHLNEVNPDKPIFQLVDKTDLIRNSTEFCFIPTGVFEIESVGLVLRPQPQEGQAHDSLSVQNLLRGKRKIITEVKLYDIYRETTQRDFYMGNFRDFVTPPFPNATCETTTNHTLISGPESDVGPAPYENNFGYVTLGTIGGSSDNFDSYITECNPFILGITWTAQFPDEMYDYSGLNPANPGQPARVYPELQATMSLDGGNTWLSDTNNMMSKKNWWTWVFQYLSSDSFKYKVKFEIGGLDCLQSVLLDTPILDDFTIYYKDGKIEFLSWVLV